MRFLRKSTLWLYVAFDDGDYSSSLSGEHLSLDDEAGRIVLGLDLSNNLRVRDTSTSAYQDAIKLAQKQQHVRFLEMDVDFVAEALESAMEAQPRAELMLRVKLGEAEPLTFPVRADFSGISVRLWRVSRPA